MTAFANRLAAALEGVKLSALDQLLLDQAQYGGDFYVIDTLVTADIAATGDDKKKFTLPLLPAGHVWRLGGTGDVAAKASDCGSAGNTVAQLRGPSGNLATFTIANSDTNDTYVNAGSVSTDDIAPGTEMRIDLDTKATAVVAPITFKIKFVRVSVRAMFEDVS